MMVHLDCKLLTSVNTSSGFFVSTNGLIIEDYKDFLNEPLESLLFFIKR